MMPAHQPGQDIFRSYSTARHLGIHWNYQIDWSAYFLGGYVSMYILINSTHKCAGPGSYYCFRFWYGLINGL